MNYEQRYKEALDEAKAIHKIIKKDLKPIIEQIFPELKESREEKIRKELIQYLKDYPNLPNGQYSRNDFFTWLEKQTELATMSSNLNKGECIFAFKEDENRVIKFVHEKN